MPCDATPRITAGSRFATTITCLPTIWSGAYASAMPATIDRGVGSPRSTERWSNFLALGTAVALSTVPTRSSILLNSSILIEASGAERGSADAGDGPGAVVGAGGEAGAAVGAGAGAADAG